MKFLAVFAVLSSSLLPRNFVDTANENTAIELHNPLTAFQQCSKGNKEWRICRGNYSPEWYCPTVLEFNLSQFESCLDDYCPQGPCFTCPDADSDCEKVVSDFLTTHQISANAAYNGNLYDDNWSGSNVADQFLLACQELCQAGEKGDACSTGYIDYDGYYHGDSCTPSSTFCDFGSDEEFAKNIPGTCKACPLDPIECYQDGFVTSLEGKRNCARCTLYCNEEGTSRLTLNGNNIPTYPITQALQMPHQYASGPVIDCSNLLLMNEDQCAGAGGHICIVDYSILGEFEVGKFNWELSNVAERSGCLAIISSGRFSDHGFDELAIPFVIVPEDDRKHLLKSEPNLVAQVEVQLFGSTCFYTNAQCNSKLPCPERHFCNYSYAVVDDEYREGFCSPCPTFENGEPDPYSCLYDRTDYEYNTYSWTSLEAVDSCAKACDATLVSDDCKFCSIKVSQFDFGVEDKADQCYFCPSNDVKYPKKILPNFGNNVTCWMTEVFFNRMEMHKDASYCHLAQSMNYLCGCGGTGYAGANTRTKQVILVWLPRVSAIFSIVGSMFIIYDTLRTSWKRVKLMNQLLSTLSLFDIMGSIAYALTTIPTPEWDEIYGSKGNMRTCKAQGFFIQIGTIACFLNVSLALYYLLTIKYGWTEERLTRKRSKCCLFAPPIGVGLVYAFVGIQYYNNTWVWCNNYAEWWPEVPVILAIIAGTGIMGSLCHHVYKIENQTAQYTNNESRLFMKVFKQSCWFIMAFYITWVPYLTLQYMMSSGKGYDNYSLFLSAATLVPLQGFWNCLVYIRTRYLSKCVARVVSSIHRVLSFFQRSSKADAPEQTILNSLQQSRLHDNLQVVQVYDSERMSSEYEA